VSRKSRAARVEVSGAAARVDEAFEKVDVLEYFKRTGW
jgi:hypothetical protein